MGSTVSTEYVVAGPERWRAGRYSVVAVDTSGNAAGNAWCSCHSAVFRNTTVIRLFIRGGADEPDRDRSPFWYHAGIVESLAVWTRVLGVLLVVLGTVLLLEPDVTYHWRERVLHTTSVDVTARRERVIVVPRALSVLVIGAGIVALVAARKRAQR